jgi:tetratricopeptide (TPR) repeat protein
MKNIFFTVLLAAAALHVAAQEPAKQARKAKSSLVTFNMDPNTNGDKLTEAKALIDEAMTDATMQADAGNWITKGNIYNTILQRDLTARLLNPNAPLSGDNDALVAFEAFQKGYTLGTKKFEKTDAAKGVTEVQANLINMGVAKYELGDYGKALASFEAVISSHELLQDAQQKSLLDDPEKFEDQVFTNAITATLAKDCDKALKYYNMLYSKGTDKPAVYDGMYTCMMETGKTAEAQKILSEGRKRFPNDASLLFSEINVYLKEGKLTELTGQLKQAIALEPNNVSLYVTLGSIYDNLANRELKEKQQAKADEYGAEARKYYQDALRIDPNNVEAYYAMGAMHYNKAALVSEEMNAMPEDFTSAGIKKYDAMKDRMMKEFELALPYFEKAEALDPNDRNTLIALSEIYARKDDLEKSKEFKNRLEVVNKGGKNPGSYFKN